MQHRQTLELAPGPRSVHDARRWVVATCREIGRDDLVDCAELAISELVTNAVLHGEPPVRMQLSGTADLQVLVPGSQYCPGGQLRGCAAPPAAVTTANTGAQTAATIAERSNFDMLIVCPSGDDPKRHV